MGHSVSVRSGIRQEAFCLQCCSISINSLIGALRYSDFCCHLGDEYIGCIAYADDIILLSASLVKLQNMLDICCIQGASLDIQFNADKSYLFVVSKSYGEVLPAISINGAPIVWANSLRYLGVNFVSDKRLNIDISQVMRKFHAAANAIFHIANMLQNLLSCFYWSHLPYQC